MKIKRYLASLLLLLALTVSSVPAFAASKNVSDDFLVDTIRQKLASDAVVKGGAIDVEVKDGAVVLKGKVEDPKQRVKAEKLTKRVSGVKSVVNQIVISTP